MTAGAICSAEGCERPSKSRGLCNTHYERVRLGRDATELPSKRRCSVDGCDVAPRGSDMCGHHLYSRRKKPCPGCGAAISHSAQMCRSCRSLAAVNAVGDEVRECHLCLGVKPLASFRMYDGNRSLKQRHVNCIECEDAYVSLVELIGAKSAVRLKAYAKRIGVPMQEIAQTYPSDGACQACGRIGVNGKRLALDHCHRTGDLRGWLCDWCNAGIGLAGDDIAGVRKWLAYLERFEPDNAWINNRAEE